MAQDAMKWIAIAVVAYLVFGMGGGEPGTTPSPAPEGCAYAPTVDVQEVDKWDANLPGGDDVQYILNGGSSTIDVDGTFEVTFGDTLKVLHGYDNRTTYYRDIGTYKIDKCGLNIVKFEELVLNTSFTVQCFNQEGNLIDDTSENETLAAGDEVTLTCQILGVSERGMPHGGVMVVELNATTYEEEKTKLGGSIVGAETTVPAPNTVTSTAHKAYAWEIEPILDAGTRTFDLTFKAETGINPTQTDGGTDGVDLILKLYSKNAFLNSETGDFEVGVVNEDNNLVGSKVGSETVQVD